MHHTLYIINNKDDGKSVTKFGGTDEFYSSYGSNEIPSDSKGIYKWTLRMIGRIGSRTAIGISSTYDTGGFLPDFTGATYLITSKPSVKFRKDLKSNDAIRHGPCPSSFSEGDKVTLILDLSQKLLKILINDVDDEIFFDDIQKEEQIKFRLMVILYEKNSGVEIKNFQEL